MNEFNLYSIDSAPEAAKQIMINVEKHSGFLPNLVRGLAESPLALEAFVSLTGIFGRSSFSHTEKEVIYMTIVAENGCDYCVDFHSNIAQKTRAPDEIVIALRNGEKISDPKLEILSQVTRKLVQERG